MFESLSQYRRIFVSGAPFVGTTICSTLIRKEIGLTWKKHRMSPPGGNWPHTLKWSHTNGRRMIIQNPQWVSILPEKVLQDPESVIVWVRRDFQELFPYAVEWGWGQRKEGRKGVGCLEAHGMLKETRDEWQAKSLESKLFDLMELNKKLNSDWETIYRPQTLNWMEVDYPDMESHPSWIIPLGDREYIPVRDRHQDLFAKLSSVA